MFVVTPASAKQIVFGTLDQDFKNGFANAGPDDWAPQVAQIKGASSLNITIPWSDPVGRLEADRGEFKYQNLPVRALQLVSKYYKRWLGIEREASWADQYNVLGAQVTSLGGSCRRWGNELITYALRNGGQSNPDVTGYTWYDGKAVFATDHPVDPSGVLPGTWANKFTKMPLTLDNLIQGFQQMAKGVKLPNGVLANVMPNKLYVSASNYWAAKEFLETDYLARSLAAIAGVQAGATSSNFLKGIIQPTLLPELADTDASLGTGIGAANEPDVWYLADERPSHPKAIQVYQMVPPRAKFLNNDSDGTVMKDNKYYYIGEAHGVAAVVGAWWIARFEPV